MFKKLFNRLRGVSETEMAKYAVADFVDTVFLNEKSLTYEKLERTVLQMNAFAETTPMPQTRVRNDFHMDVYCKSFWHCCCVVLTGWATDRFRVRDHNFNTCIYRGQANTWRLRPSLWRAPTNTESQALKTFKDFLQPTQSEVENSSIQFFPDFTTTRGVRAFAQHHEFPTGLLDFSFSPIIALFFASRNSNPMPTTNEVKGLGVIYECPFNRVEEITNMSGAKGEFVLFPPSHIFRLYQQRGMFIDCGDNINERVLDGIEQTCRKFYFPRQYPEMKDVDIIFNEDTILALFSNDLGPLGSRVNHEHAHYWYNAFDFYALAAESLKSYCNINRCKFNSDDALSMLHNATKELDRPMWIMNDFGAARNGLGFRVAESMAIAANAIHDNVIGIGPNGRFANRQILQAYANANPTFFDALFQISDKISIFKLEEFAHDFRLVDGIEASVRGSLTKNEKKFLDRLPELHYGR